MLINKLNDYYSLLHLGVESSSVPMSFILIRLLLSDSETVEIL
nr:MAG TPA: hypothetical protein [Caudoviricetes sp.]